MSLLDALAYPWDDPVARELHRTLISVQPAVPSAALLAQQAGVETGWINTQQSVALVWKEILDTAAAAGLLRALVSRLLDRLPPPSPARPFLDELMAGASPPISAEPRDAEGMPTFLRGDDDVGEPEALLFGDDLTMPVGQIPGLVRTLTRLLELAPSVCKLTVDFGAGEQYGTAFRIAPDFLLTNWHVVHRRTDGAPADRATAEFGFEDDSERGPLAPTVVRCEAISVAEDKADDWAVVRTVDQMEGGWAPFELSDLAEPSVEGHAFVIQHPQGQRKRIGFLRNRISYVDDRVVHYLTDTDVGSSGSPVLDSAGRLIALHHRGGLPRAMPLGPPLRKNEGIRMSRIVVALVAAGVA